jgi:hypothetical protein
MDRFYRDKQKCFAKCEKCINPLLGYVPLSSSNALVHLTRATAVTRGDTGCVCSVCALGPLFSPDPSANEPPTEKEPAQEEGPD